MACLRSPIRVGVHPNCERAADGDVCGVDAGREDAGTELGQNNLYLESYSTVLSSGGDTVAQITVGNVAVPTSPTGTAVSPSPTLHPVTTLLNDTACAGTPTPAVVFAGTSPNATASVTTTGGCAGTLSGGGFRLRLTVSFTPTVAGYGQHIAYREMSQTNNTGTVAVAGTGSGFTLSASAPTLAVTQATITPGHNYCRRREWVRR